MKKALCYGPLDLRIVDVPERDPGPGEVKAKMLLTTLTTANTRLYTGPLVADLQYPVTLSYTGIAEVTEVGEGVTSFRPGDRVYPNWYRACGHCPMCRADRMVACVNVPERGHNMLIGEQHESALQESIVFPADRLWYVPKHVPIETAALVGGLAVSLQAISFLGPEPGDWVLIVGAGPIGWGAIQHAALRSARIIAVDVKPDRLEQAKRFGAEVTIDANAQNVKEVVRGAVGGLPYFVAETSGTAPGSQTAFDCAARGAKIACVGVTGNELTQHQLINKGLTVKGIGGGIGQQKVIDLIAVGKLDLAPCITHRYPFSQLREAFERRRTDPEAIRVAIEVDRWE